MASSYLQKFPVPESFPEILADLTKSILKEQPSDIIEFSYHYFKTKVEGKDEPIAERKNYYGNQIKKQKRNGKAEVIQKPDRLDSSHSQQRANTEVSNQTKKMAANQFVDDLTEQALDMYENNLNGDGRPRTSGDRIPTGESNPRSEPVNIQHIPEEEEEIEEEMTEEQKRYKRIFDRIDKNKSGFISLNELEVYLKSIGHDLSNEQVQRFFTIMDGDGSKLIEFHEFFPFLQNVIGNIGPESGLTDEEKHRILFTQIDTNKSGMISKDELAKGLQRIGFEVTKEQAGALIEAMDTNQSRMVDFQEFHTFMLDFMGPSQNIEVQIPEATGPNMVSQGQEAGEGEVQGGSDTMYRENMIGELIKRTFDFYDFDRSGTLDKKELRRLVDDISNELKIPTVPQSKLESFVEKCDQNNDGKFNFEEYSSFAKPVFNELLKEKLVNVDEGNQRSRPMSKGELESQIKGAINDLYLRYDIDQSGLLERNEIIFLLNDLADFLNHPRIAPEMIDPVIMKFDQTKDGKWNPQELFNFAYPYFSKLVREREAGERTEIQPTQNIPEPIKVTEETIQSSIDKNFAFFDKDNSGYLEQGEIKNLLDAISKELKMPLMPPEAIQDFIDLYDENGDKKFTKEEAYDFMKPAAIAIEKKRAEEIANMRQNMTQKGYQAPPMPQINDAQIQAVIDNYFTNFDKDQSGYLETEEIKKMVDAVFFKLKLPSMPDKDIEGFISIFDQDQDKKFNREEAFLFLRPAVYSMVAMQSNQGAPPAPQQNIMSEQALRDAIEVNFKFFDKDNSGYLERSEIKSLIEAIASELNFQKPIDEQVDQFISEFDLNGDKKFDRAEAFAFLRPIILTIEEAKIEKALAVTEAALDEAIKQNFSNFDSNQNGYLEVGEIKNLIQAVTTQLGFDRPIDNEVEDLIAVFDQDGDRKFSIEEAYAFLRPIVIAIDQQAMENGGIMTEKALRETIALNFSHFDKDNTGYLELGEIKNFLQAVGKEMNMSPDVNLDEAVETFIQTFDQDGDKKFNIEEAFLFLKPIVLSMEADAKEQEVEEPEDQVEANLKKAILDVFQEMDQDKSGLLEKDEIKPMLQKITEKYNFKRNIDSLVYQFMKEFDTDGDRKFNIDEAYKFLKPIILSVQAQDEGEVKVKYDDFVEACASFTENPGNDTQASPLVPKNMVNLMMTTIFKSLEYTPNDFENYIIKQFQKDVPRYSKTDSIGVNIVFNFMAQLLCPEQFQEREIEEPTEWNDKKTGIAISEHLMLSAFLYNFINLSKDREDKSQIEAKLVKPLTIMMAFTAGYSFLSKDSTDIQGFTEAITTDDQCSYADIYTLVRAVFCTPKGNKQEEAYNLDALKQVNDEQGSTRDSSLKEEAEFNTAYEAVFGEVFGEKLDLEKLSDFIAQLQARLKFAPASDDTILLELMVKNMANYTDDDEALKFDLRAIFIGPRHQKAEVYFNRLKKIQAGMSLSDQEKTQPDERDADDRSFYYSIAMPDFYVNEKIDSGLSLDMYALTIFHARNYGLGDTGENSMKQEAIYNIIRDAAQRQLRILDVNNFVACWKSYIESCNVPVENGKVSGSVCFTYLRPAFYNLYALNKEFVKEGEAFCAPDYEKAEFKTKLDEIADGFEFNDQDCLPLEGARKFIQAAFEKLYKGKINETQTDDIYETVLRSLPQEPGNMFKRVWIYKSLRTLIAEYYFEPYFNPQY